MGKILSIIVPSYNMEAYLPKCLGSLVVDDKKLLQELDVIVVNDGSKDRTSEIAHGFETKYPGVFRVIDKENGHYGSCINAGLALASGFYVKVLDADDWFASDSFASYIGFLLQEVENNSVSADMVLSDFDFVFEDGKSRRKSYDFMVKAGLRLSCLDFRDGRNLWQHAVAFQTGKLRSIGYRQLTGLTHTDLQWIFHPVTTVEKVAYFTGGAVYQYNFLREGNTFGPTGINRTFPDREKVLLVLLRHYLTLTGHITAEQDEYLRNFLKYYVMRSYHVHIVKRNPCVKRESLVELDDLLRNELTWLYNYADGLTLEHGCPYRYVHAWRRKRRMTVGISVKLRFLDLVSRIWGRVRRLFK